MLVCLSVTENIVVPPFDHLFCCFRPRACCFYSQLKRAKKSFIMPGHYKKIMPTQQPIRAYGVYVSQLVIYVRICTSKVDFMNRLRGLSLRLRQQGFLTNLLQRTFTKFFNRHGLIVVKYAATLREMTFAIQA